MGDGAKFWLLSGYSGAGNDIALTKVDADGTLTAQAALRTGENPSCLCAGTRPGVYYAGWAIAAAKSEDATVQVCIG